MTDQLADALDEPEVVQRLDLAAGFPVATRDDWRRLVATVLGDAVPAAAAGSPEQLLTTRLPDGIDVRPLYTAQDAVADPGYPGEAPFIRGSSAAGHRDGWDVRQRVDDPSPAVARDQATAELEGGATSLWLQVGDGQIPLAALGEVLTDVYLDLVTVVLDAGEQTPAAADALLALAGQRGLAAEAVSASLGADPLGLSARDGSTPDLKPGVALAARCVSDYPRARAFVVDATAYHDAGATDAEELGCSLATGVAYLRAMQAAGISAGAAFGQLEFRYAATADEFATIAKLRAARRAWSRVMQSCGVSGAAGGQVQHAVTSWPMMTRRDPWNNMLRVTLACFAAGVGGADAITVAPFDAAVGRSDELARRVARNTHALLVDESSVARVVDPAGGSWYVESLTEALAGHAWQWFQDIEAAGGMAAALTGGLVAGRVTASREQRRAALARREDAITGVSEFPLQGETLLARPSVVAAERSGGLPRIRWAQWHEELRDRADAYEQSTGSPPTVTAVSLGAVQGSAAQVDRLRSLLAPAGVTVTEAAVEELAGDAARSRVGGVCAADDVEPAQLSAAVAALRAAGCGYVIVAATAAAAGETGDDRLTPGLDALCLQERVLAEIGVAT